MKFHVQIFKLFHTKLKIYLLAILASLCCYDSSAQLGLNFIAVNRIHNDELPISPLKGFNVVHSIGAGIELCKREFPLSISFSKDYYYALDNYKASSGNRADDIDERWYESFLMLNYRLKKSYISAGYFHLEREASANLLSDYLGRDYKGLVFSFTQSIKWLDIEFKTKVNLSPGFAAILGGAPHSISFNYRISKYEHERRIENINNFEKNFEVNINLGARLFDASGIEVIQFEKGYNVGFKPAMGIELMNIKHNFGLFVEKDIWITFNAGSNLRTIKDRIVDNSFGIRYRLQTKKFNDLRFSLGLNFIRDSEVKRELYELPFQIIEKLIRNQMRGVLLGVNFEIMKNTDIEIRHTIPYISYNEKFFEPKRFSVGLNYRFDPIGN